MSTINSGIRQNDIEDTDLSSLKAALYENIFNVNILQRENDKQFYFYNTLNNISLPSNLDDSVLGEIELDRDLPWTSLSFNLYNTIDLWWLIFLVNKPDYVFLAKRGQTYKYIQPRYVINVLSQMNEA